MQLHTLPGERQRDLRRAAVQDQRVERGIRERRMQPVAARILARSLGQPHLGEQRVAAPVHRTHSAECAAVLDSGRSKAVVQMAINSLSFSESEAVEHIFDELDGLEGLLVASKIADRVGITRSVIVNALRKLESAGVIESRSLGMKGTYIKILNPNLVPALRKARS